MSCFPCFGSKKKDSSSSSEDDEPNQAPSVHRRPPEPPKPTRHPESPAPAAANPADIQAQSFTFRELATATKHFTPDSLLGEGGIVRVYKGVLENGGQAVAIKQLDRNSIKDNKEFLVEVLMLSLLHHPNLVNLVGYCADGDQRLLVYEFMPNGSLHDHLHDLKPNQKPLDWYARMRIAFGAAQGLEYLHDKANPPVIYRDLKSSKILLDDLMTPKLSDFGLAKLGSMGDKLPVTSRVMGTDGYCAPEYTRNGELTLKSDVYSFGVVLLELISGRRALDPSKPMSEQNLVTWAQPMFKEQKRYPELVDPILQGNYPLKSLNQAVAIIAMCLQEESSVRPLMADVVMTISFLIEPTPPTPEASPAPAPAPAHNPPVEAAPEPQRKSSSSSSSSDSDENVVETLQLGQSKRGKGSKAGSRCSSGRSSSSRSCSGSSGDDDGSSSKRRSKRRSSSKRHRKKASKDGSDSSSSSKHSRSSSRFGSSRCLSLNIGGGSSKHGSGRSSSREGSRRGSDGDGSGSDSGSGSGSGSD